MKKEKHVNKNYKSITTLQWEPTTLTWEKFFELKPKLNAIREDFRIKDPNLIDEFANNAKFVSSVLFSVDLKYIRTLKNGLVVISVSGEDADLKRWYGNMRSMVRFYNNDYLGIINYSKKES